MKRVHVGSTKTKRMKYAKGLTFGLHNPELNKSAIQRNYSSLRGSQAADAVLYPPPPQTNEN